MPNVTISELPAASSVNSSDVFPIVQGDTTKKASISQISVPIVYGTTADTATEGNDARVATIKANSVSTIDGTSTEYGVGGLGGDINLSGGPAINDVPNSGDGSGGIGGTIEMVGGEGSYDAGGAQAGNIQMNGASGADSSGGSGGSIIANGALHGGSAGSLTMNGAYGSPAGSINTSARDNGSGLGLAGGSIDTSVGLNGDKAAIAIQQGDIRTNSDVGLSSYGGYIDTRSSDGSGGNIDTSCHGVGESGGSILTYAAGNGAGGTISTYGGTAGNGGSINTSNLGGYIHTYDEGGYIATENLGGYINTSEEGGYINTSGEDGGFIDTRADPSNGGVGGYIKTRGDGNFAGGFINTAASEEFGAGGSINTSGGGNIYTADGGGGINTSGTGTIHFGNIATRTALQGSATALRTIFLPNASGTLALTSQLPSDASAITSGVFANARINWASPSAIGSTAAAAATFTTLTSTGFFKPQNASAMPPDINSAFGIRWSGIGGADYAHIFAGYAGIARVGIGIGSASTALSSLAYFDTNAVSIVRSINSVTVVNRVVFPNAGGFFRLYSSDGTTNMVLGYGPQTTSIHSNLAFGENCLASVTTAINAIAIGQFAGDAITSGDRNVLIGMDAGGAITTGGNNTALGANALGASTGGSKDNNTAVGASAGQQISSGSGNTMIGAYATVDAGTRSLCVCIGRNTVTPAVNGSLAIGGTTASGGEMTNLIANTAGGSAGKHLNIYLNGVQYKIALLNA